MGKVSHLPIKIRLQKFLAQAGIASRRKAEELIVAGKVRVNGTIVRKLGTTVGEDDRVEVDRKPVTLAQTKMYLVMHKPLGVVTTMSDPEGRRTVRDFLPKGLPRVVPVGRLDYDTSGVLLLTNDGDLANRLMHPKFGVEKTYRVVVSGKLSPSEIVKLQHGVRLEDRRTAPARLRIVRSARERSILDLTIHEGRNRQVRRMLEALDHPVVTLERRSFGPIKLGNLAPGATRPVSERELTALRALSI